MTWMVIALGAAGLWWFTRFPSHTRDWQDDVARMPTAEVSGERAVVRNVRNFRYRTRTDYGGRWEERSLDLSKLDGLDAFFSHWTGPHIAHTILSWSFSDGQHLAISIETRKRKGQEYSAIAGFLRQYELIYVAGDERDLIGQRVFARGEEVYLYRLKVPPAAARKLLLEYFADMNRLARKPRWYNAFATNCTTAIRRRVLSAGGKLPFSWRLFANGWLPELLYDMGSLDTSRPFAELKAEARINERALAGGVEGDFPSRIRAASPPAR